MLLLFGVACEKSTQGREPRESTPRPLSARGAQRRCVGLEAQRGYDGPATRRMHPRRIPSGLKVWVPCAKPVRVACGAG